MHDYIIFLRSPFLGRATNANELRRSQNDRFWSISNGLSQSYSHFSRGQEMLALGMRLRSPCHTSWNLCEHDLRCFEESTKARIPEKLSQNCAFRCDLSALLMDQIHGTMDNKDDHHVPLLSMMVRNEE